MMLHGVSLTLITFGNMHQTLEGRSFTIFILTVAACEAALALALILALYQKSKSLDVELWTELREPGMPPPTFEADRDQPPLPPPRLWQFPVLSPAGRSPEIPRPTPADKPDNESTSNQ
jgi:NADH-quinone oxidoreductase subunit K